MRSATTMLHYLDFLAVEVRRKRISLGLTASNGRCLILCDKATLILCDKATQHHSKDFEQARAQLEEAHNSIIVHGQSTRHGIQIPGGWGAAGGPNDGWHQHFHGLPRAYQKFKAGLGCSLEVRKDLAALDTAVDGVARFTSFDSTSLFLISIG